jgi:hypothetical protein
MRTVIKVYRTYSFKDKDPVIDEMRTLVENGEIDQYEAATRAGLARSTVDNWFFGSTRRPQSASVEAFGRALGWKRSWVKMNGNGEK